MLGLEKEKNGYPGRWPEHRERQKMRNLKADFQKVSTVLEEGELQPTIAGYEHIKTFYHEGMLFSTSVDKKVVYAGRSVFLHKTGSGWKMIDKKVIPPSPLAEFEHQNLKNLLELDGRDTFYANDGIVYGHTYWTVDPINTQLFLEIEACDYSAWLMLGDPNLEADAWLVYCPMDMYWKLEVEDNQKLTGSKISRGERKTFVEVSKQPNLSMNFPNLDMIPRDEQPEEPTKIDLNQLRDVFSLDESFDASEQFTLTKTNIFGSRLVLEVSRSTHTVKVNVTLKDQTNPVYEAGFTGVAEISIKGGQFWQFVALFNSDYEEPVQIRTSSNFGLILPNWIWENF